MHDLNPEMDYYANTALSHSRLKEIRKSAGHFKWMVDNESPSTDAMNLGSLVHAMVLEPHTVESRFAVMPKFDRRTKQGKADREQWFADNPLHTPLTATEWNTAKAMSGAVYAHPEACSLVENVIAHGTAEQEFYWEDRQGITRKAKVDGIHYGSEGRQFIVDLKTTIDASPSGFRKSISKYCYGTQMAYYVEAAETVRSEAVIIAVAKTPPYGVGLYRFGPEAIERSGRVVNKWLETYLECTKSGVWPSFWDTQNVDIPDWFLTSNGVNDQ
tara:strand:- start:1262 stop:2077 length:816 start_codon:yes stop_codon:yes gene_type:complete